MIRAICATAVMFAITVGCSSSKSAGSAGDSGTPCTRMNALKIVFSPMYSAVIPGDDTYSFELPAIVPGLSGDAVRWQASDPSAVSIQPDPSTGGALLTMLSTAKSPGAPVTITASAGAACGTAVLNITAATTADWVAGEGRYNDRVSLDGGARAACANCHAPQVDAGRKFNDIAHTPEQAGGFSDQQLLTIIQDGQIPDGGYFDPGIISYEAWQSFHQWDLTAAEQAGIVIYLRSLVPTAQGGTANFGGLGAPDGGGT
jgi:hypothetical protein